MTTNVWLSAWLSSMDAAQLERCLTLRSDVVRGAPPADLDELAERLVHPASVASSLLALPLGALQVIELAAALGSGASVRTLADRLGGSHDTVAHLVRVLQGAALAWPGPSGEVVVNPGVTQVLTTPLGLGRPAATILTEVSAPELAKVARRWGLAAPQRKAELVAAVGAALGDPEHVRAVVAGAPEPVARVIQGWVQDAAGRLAPSVDLDLGPAEDELPAYLRSPAAYGAYRVAATWAREHGIAYGPSYGPGDEVPCEVLLALIDPQLRVPFDPAAPQVATAAVAEAQVAGGTAGAVTGLMSAATGVLEHLSRHPVALLRAGGVGARELTRTAKALGVDVAVVRLTLECAATAGLIAPGADGLGTSVEFDAWRRRSPGRRAADLWLAWQGLAFAPTQDRDESGAAVPALARDPFHGHGKTARHLALTAMATEPGRGVAHPDALVETVVWRLPLAVGRRGAPGVRATWDEAQLLGVAAYGRLGEAGRALIAGDEAGLVSALEQMLPAVQRRVLIGSDHTVVVTGTPDVAVVDLLDAVAVRESRGAASTWRLTPASVRDALDAGYELTDLLEGLHELAGGPLPQATEYLLRDVGRRHGHLRVVAAAAVVVSDDEALLAEVAAHRSLRRLGLRAVAPTVLVAEADPAQVLLALRGQGYLPVQRDADGAPVVRLRRVARGATSGGATGGEAGGASDGETGGASSDDGARRADDGARWDELLDEPLAALAERLLHGGSAPARDLTPVEHQIMAATSRLSGPEVRQLAHAVEHGLPVQIRYRAASGGVTVRVVSDLSLERGYLWGFCHLRQDDRHFLVSSILEVTPPAGGPWTPSAP